MPAATATLLGRASRTRPARILPRLLLWSWVLAFLALAVTRAPSLAQVWARHWPDLLFWLALVVVVDLFPVTVGERSLTLDLPLLLAVAFSFSPEAGASVAFLGAMDRRELRREVTVAKALLNRIQISLSVLGAGYAFHLVGGPQDLWWRVLLAVVVALVVDYVINVVLVSSILLGLAEAPSFRAVLAGLRIGGPVHFLAAYLGYGTLAFGLSRLYESPGAWAVVMLLTPVVVARQALVRTQELERARRRLSRVLNEIVDERRDERGLIAGELHDDVLQQVVRTQLAALAAERELHPAAAEELRGVVRASGAAMAALREVIRGLRRSPLGRGGLVPALGQLVVMLESEWGRKISTSLPPAVSLGPEAQLVAYQGAREGLVNALKHSGATTILLRLEEAGPEARLVIRDDGDGMDPDRVAGDGHFGLSLLRERLAGVGGRLRVTGGGGNGTTLELTLPLASR